MSKIYKLSGHGMKRVEELLDAVERGQFKVELIFWDGAPHIFEVKVMDSIICIWDLNPSELVNNLKRKILLAKTGVIAKEEKFYFANGENFDNSIPLRAVDVMEVEQ